MPTIQVTTVCAIAELVANRTTFVGGVLTIEILIVEEWLGLGFVEAPAVILVRVIVCAPAIIVAKAALALQS